MIKAIYLGTFVFFVVATLLPNSANAQCAKWDASGYLEIFQRGQFYAIELLLEQKGRVISGKAVHHIPNNFGEITNNGLVDGTIDGDRISFQIFWPPNGSLIGVYEARIQPSGRLDGETYDKNNPKIRQTWFSGGTLKCPPPPVIPKPIKSTGKPRSTGKARPEPSPSKASPPEPMKVPGIIASQVIYSVAGASMGIVVLTWDAGPDHPYAEIWYKVNNGEETFLVEQGKGSRQMPVERGKYYTYILTDAAKTLATVNVVGN
ncbi:MAG: hypothetical protein QM785_08525 [Pyrinomonadaceae bacterium]